MTTELGTFTGIGQEPTIHRNLIRVTGAFDDLLGPERGWTYLFALSPNYERARALALRMPGCLMDSGAELEGTLAELIPTLARAYVEGNSIDLQMYADPDRLRAHSSRPEADIVAVHSVRPCGLWGNEKLAFALANTAYDARGRIGHTLVLLVLRNRGSQWQLLVAARDPISNGEFVQALPGLTAQLTTDRDRGALPAPATLVSPATGKGPRAPAGRRFGTFTWRSSPSSNVVAEIAEFAYLDDARLFLTRPMRPGSRGQVSAGKLWTTRSDWTWRIWSLTATGDLAITEGRTFPH